ncbi:MAG: DUF4010 domain-containing protein [Thermoanaerobaculia bacterium]|nr:DUF4010 domain-containing protein [Thermoanaerobaculia bacterium]
MVMSLDLATVQSFALALLIGALIGIEREKRMAEEGGVGAHGLRTFILYAELGALGGFLAIRLASPWILVATLAAVVASVVAGYVQESRARSESIGLTTEAAALVVSLLGALVTLGYPALAGVLGIATAATLAYKDPLHTLIRKLGWPDVYAGLRLLVATFIVLPFLPNRAVDPWGALNPYSLWKLVLLISALSLVGYAATRLLGADKGAALTGLTGGLASSTAVTLSFARRSREEGENAPAAALASGILVAWAVMFARVLVEVLVVNRDLVGRVAVPFSAMGLAALAAAAYFFWQGARDRRVAPQAAPGVPLTNPFSLTSAAKFAAFFALVLLVVKLAQGRLPGAGVYVVAALAGLTDVDAITLSMAQYARTGSPEVAVTAIVVAALSNTLTKCVLVAVLGGASLRKPVLVATGAVIAAGAVALLAG